MNEKECNECKNIIRESLTWRHYFSEQDVMNALILDDNPELLRKVRACQQQLNDVYAEKTQILDGQDADAKMKVRAEFRKPEIDIAKL